MSIIGCCSVESGTCTYRKEDMMKSLIKITKCLGKFDITNNAKAFHITIYIGQVVSHLVECNYEVMTTLYM